MQTLRSTLLLLALVGGGAYAQDTLPKMPRYDRYEKLRREIAASVTRGSVTADWADDSKSVNYFRDAVAYKYDIEAKKESIAVGDPNAGRTRRPTRDRRTPERGRQFDTAISADGKLKAIERNRNVYISDADGKNEIAVTTEGGIPSRIKFGVASWVYGEELGVREAMWWSPDGTKLAFYKFDENPVKDYYLQYTQVAIQDTLDVEAYPKAGAPNPIVTLYVYDLATKKTTAIDTKFADPTLGEYVYDVRWSPDGKELLFNRTDRKQHVMELCAANPDTGEPRAIVRESQPQSWAENHPVAQFLKDHHRFIWESERNGYKNLYLYDISGKLISPITNHEFDVDRVVKTDDDEKTIWYTARSGKNPYMEQLHRVNLDGTHDERLTDPAMSHTVSVSPDGSHFVDVAQTVDTPPTSTLRTANGKEVAQLAKSDTTKFDQLGLKKTERITFTAADGKTLCYGTLKFPSDFDPSKKYPLLVSIYGGPESSGGAEQFQTPDPITEMGFVVAWLDGRGTSGRGKAFRDAVYGKLGVVEIDDQAAGVKELTKRPYLDSTRVGIQGTSYGGYASCMAILRHPEAFQVACASSPVTDWLNYDSIYTERFMGLPGKGENEDGYANAAAKKYVRNLTGKLMLYYGTADNNVHPSNTLQLVQALEDAGQRYDLQVGPDRGHSGMNQTRMWEYFVTHLILNPPKKDALAIAWQARKTRKAGK